MHDDVPPNPGLARRIDLFALSNPQANRRAIWAFGVLSVWSLIGLVSSVVAQRWSVVAILSGTVVVAGLMRWVNVRAKRRAPETRKWLDESSG